MGFRFRKRVRLAPGFALNLSKSGPSLSVGGHGLTANVGRRGVTETASIPGSGISYRRSVGHGHHPHRHSDFLAGLFGLVILYFIVKALLFP